MTIHAVFCNGADEKDAVVTMYKKSGLSVTWFGPDDPVRAEKLSGTKIVRCGDCEAGPDAFLVVAGAPPNSE